MIVENLEVLGQGLEALARTRITNAMSRLANMVGTKGSVTKDASSSSFIFALIGSDDIPHEALANEAKMFETKFAWDIKTILERDIVNADEVSFKEILKKMPHGNALLFDMEDILNGENKAESYTPSLDDLVNENMSKIYNGFQSINVEVIEGYAPSLECPVEEYAEEVLMEASKDSVIEPSRNPIPTMVNIAIKYKTDNKQIKDITFTFQVKCIPHVVNYRELYTRIADADFNFTKRWVKFRKDQEFKFLKDLMLDITNVANKAKYDVRKNPVFIPVENAKAIKSLGGSSFPFVCYTISEAMYEEIKEKEGIDLKVVPDAKRLLDKSLGMALSIYRGSGIEILYDSSTAYEFYTMADIVKESSRVAKDLRETISYYKRGNF